MTYKHSWITMLKRLIQRFLVWRAQPLRRPFCWFCGHRFAPRRTQSSVVVQCLGGHPLAALEHTYGKDSHVIHNLKAMGLVR